MGRAGNIVLIIIIVFLLINTGTFSYGIHNPIHLTPRDNVVVGHQLDIELQVAQQVRIQNLYTSELIEITLPENNGKKGRVTVGGGATDPNIPRIQCCIIDPYEVIRVTGLTTGETKDVWGVIVGQANPTGNRQAIEPPVDYYDVPGCTLGDNDGDRICDEWENDPNGNTLTITDPAGNTYVYNCMSDNETWSAIRKTCKNTVKDVFVELDWMLGHDPDPNAVKRVVDAFANAPVDCDASGGNCKGIHLHVQVDSARAMGHTTELPFPGLDYDYWPQYKGFDQVKGNNFGTFIERTSSYPQANWDSKNDPHRILKHQVFHYGLFVHDREDFVGQSGVGEIDGNDFMVSLGSFTGQVGSTDQQAGTLMHELGHNLGLNHGGDRLDTTNHKPNYFSVMSYSRQFADYDPNRPLDYSGKVLGHQHTSGKLDENSLKEKEPWGIEPYPGHNEGVIYSCPAGNLGPLYYKAGTNVNWNCNSVIESGVLPPSSNHNINNLPSEPDPAPAKDVLFGYNDWNNLDFDFSDNSDYVDGVHTNNGNGISGGKTPPGLQMLINTGIPIGKNLGQLQQDASEYAALIGQAVSNQPDTGFQYKSNEKDELTIQGTTAARIAHQLSLYGEVVQLPEQAFNPFHGTSYEEIDPSSEIIFVQMSSTPSINLPPITLHPSEVLPKSDFSRNSFENTLELYGGKQIKNNLSIKGIFLAGIELAIDQINHHDLERAKFLIQLIDVGLDLSLNDVDYDKVAPIIGNLTASYDIALDFKKTDFHDEEHKRVSDPIIAQNEVDLMIKRVADFYSGTTPSCPPPKVGTPPNCECPDGMIEAGGLCIPPPQRDGEELWWLWALLVAIGIAIGISAWLGSRRRYRP